MANQEMIRIRLKAYDHQLIDSSAAKIVETAKGWYISLARVGGICGFFKSAHCDDAGDCGLAGNFCGVCPVIGRLNCF